MGATTPPNFIQIEGPLPSSGRSFMDKLESLIVVTILARTYIKHFAELN